MAGGWTAAATKALIGIWWEPNVQEQLDNVRGNQDTYKGITKEIGELGYLKKLEMCRVRVKNLTRSFREVN